MLREMSAAEFGAWRRFYELEPFGCATDDGRFGSIASLIANVFRDKHRHPEPFTAGDFFPREKLATDATPAAGNAGKPAKVLQILEAAMLARGGADKRSRRPNYGVA